MKGLARGFYSLLLLAAQPLLLRKLRRRGRQEPGYLQAVGERFGRYDAPAQPGALWIHAVSLGETRAAAILAQALRRHDPGLRLLLTHGTATGRAEGGRLLGPGDQQAWLPWDTPGAVARFLDHFRPRAGVLMETEVWPNLVAACAQRGVPQVGARMPVVVGNLKFDDAPDPAQWAQGRAWREGMAQPVVVFASSREGEEATFLQALAPWRNTGLHWLLVPRHPQRFDAVAQLAAQAGWRVSRRSTWGAAGPDAQALAADIWLGDSLGEMPLYYGLADAALLGGSFEPLGGQNLIEAAACACPVVMGPHTFNFARACEHALDEGAALRAQDLPQAMGQAVALVRDPPRRTQMARAASQFAQAHQGAAERTAQALLALISAPADR